MAEEKSAWQKIKDLLKKFKWSKTATLAKKGGYGKYAKK